MRHWSEKEIEIFDLLQKAQQACVLQNEKFRDFTRLIPEALDTLKDDEVKKHLQLMYYSLSNLNLLKRGEKPDVYPVWPVYAFFASTRDDAEFTLCFDADSANLHYENLHKDYGEVSICTYPLSARDDVKERPPRPFPLVGADDHLAAFVTDFWDRLNVECPTLLTPNAGFGQPYAFSASWESFDYYVCIDIMDRNGVRFESFVTQDDLPLYESTHTDLDDFFTSNAFSILRKEFTT